MARPMRSRARTSARFSSREIVGCDARGRPEGAIPCAILNTGSGPQAGGVVAVLVAGRDHQHAEADHVGQRVSDQRRIARVVQAPGQALRHAEPALDLAQHQHARIR